MSITDRIRLSVLPGTVIPKPQVRSDFIVKGFGERRGEVALVYLIHNHRNPSRPYEKGLAASELEASFAQLRSTGTFTRGWFDGSLPACAKEGGCNFTSIGGIFELLGEARYAGSISEPARVARSTGTPQQRANRPVPSSTTTVSPRWTTRNE